MKDFQKVLLKNKIMNMPDLPALPSSVVTVLGYLRAEDVNLPRVSAALNKDQVLVAQVLKLINSGFFSLRHEVTNISHAVNLLGVNKLKELLYSVGVMDSLKGAYEQLWLHSYSSFCLMEDLVKQFPELDVSPTLPFTMLLHDIGQVVLHRLNPNSHQVAVQSFMEKHVMLHKFENQLMGVDHAEVGFWLLEKWELDEEILIPIQYHHSDEVPRKFIREACLVQIVDYIDSYVRNIPTQYPTIALLQAAGIEEFDREYWQMRQERMVESLDKANPANSAKPPPTLAQRRGMHGV